MRRIPLILLLIFTFSISFSQDFFNEELEIRVGYVSHKNSLNNDHYFSFKNYGLTEIDKTNGLYLEFVKPTRIKYLSLVSGLIFERGNSFSESWSSPNTKAYEVNLSGGGAYLGINPHFGNKNIGLNAKIAVGYFNYQNKKIFIDNTTYQNIDIYNIESTGGVGAIGSAGIYLRIGRIGINPSVSLILSGNSTSNCQLYGINLPISIYID